MASLPLFFSPNPTRLLPPSRLPSKFVPISVYASNNHLSSPNQIFTSRLDPQCKSWRSNCITFCSPTDFQESRSINKNSSVNGQLDIFLEVEGVLADVHRSGNLHAFNLAFQKLDLDCANWTEPIYADLTRKSGSNEEKMLTLYFSQIGWPSTLPTNEHEKFVKRLLKEKEIALEDLQASVS